MTRLVMNLLLLLVALSAQARVRKAEPALSRQAVEQVARELRARWLADARVRMASVYRDKVAKSDSLTMPLWWTVYGEKPADGYSLYISLHGGGTCPPEVNDQQWKNQKHLYEPQHCVYVAPRAPWNLWNMWCKKGIDELYEQVIQMAVAYYGVNPDKVYLMGYSAGGDGVWRMAPRMADTWAAASMMAGHPGDVSLVNLRNMPFMIWCGALDDAYDRNKLDAYRGEQMDSLQHADPEGYVHATHIVAGKGHWMDSVDTLAVEWMDQYRRNPYPKTIVWQQEEVLRPHFYWVSAPKDELARGRQVRLQVKGNTIFIARCDYSQLTLKLNDELLNLNKKMYVSYNGRIIYSGRLKRTRSNMVRTLAERNDLSYMFPAILKVRIKK